MSAYIKELTDSESNKIYPVTKASATYMGTGTTSVETVINDMTSGNSKTEFLADGSIKKTLASGDVVTTVVSANSSITATTKTAAGKFVSKKVTKFNADNSIDTTTTYEEEN